MMSRCPDDFTEEELQRISRPVDPLLYQRVGILIGSRVMMVSAARGHYMFTKCINLVGTTIFDSETLYTKMFVM